MQQSNQFTYPVSLGVTKDHFSQSLSGSETDVSTSNENLSNEEKFVIRHTPRQEPQGQENLQTTVSNGNSNRNSLRDSLTSNRSSLDVSTSSYNTLIIHSAAGDESWTGRNSGQNSSLSFGHPTPSNLFNEIKIGSKQRRSSVSPSTSAASTEVQEITDIPEDCLSQLSVLKQLAKEVKIPSSSPQRNKNTTDIVPDLISKFDKVSFNKHNMSPSREYSTQWLNKSPLQAAVNSQNKTINEKLILSKSQPDLTSVGVSKTEMLGFKRGVSAPRPPTKGREENDSKGEIWPSAEMVAILIKENSALKHELENCYQRIEKTHKLEQEIFKVHKAHEELVQSCNRREQLERAARARLQADCRQFQDLNRTLREQRDLLSSQVLSRSPDPDRLDGSESLRRELSKREGIIKQLIMQNKELAAAKERQEIEMAAQRATLQEQRTHIDILDTALTNAQGNVVRLEEENRKKQLYVERVAQLQQALYSLQTASDRREETERKLRSQLEKELQRSKNAHGNFWERKAGWDSPNNSESELVSELKRQLREKDENIMKLEGECAKWEQRYLEENSLRQAAIDAASIPKDAKIAALEKTSQETEKIITEARNEKIRHMDEVHAAQKRVADLEARMIDLESKLAQKHAMIRVLAQHRYDKDMSVLGRSPHHTPHASLAGTEIDLGLGPTVSREELVSSVLTNSTAYGSTDSSSYHMKSYSNKNFDTKPTLESHLNEIDNHLDIQLLSKRGLCCFPGLTNPIAGQRKGKIPKPLLVNVSGSSSAGRQSPFKTGENSTFFTSRHSENGPEMILLEKQGRTSQKQRMTDNTNIDGDAVQEGTNKNICPSPSSLPRPPRSSSGSSHHRSGLPRRMGDYNRLDNNHNDSTPRRKNSNDTDSLSSNTSSRHTSPARSSLIPPPRKLGEYGRLSESPGSSASLRKSSSTRIRSSSGGRSNAERDSTSTISDNSASSLPTPSKVQMYCVSNGSVNSLRRRNSLGREIKSASETNKYRIQF